jgi:hypothetical protein
MINWQWCMPNLCTAIFKKKLQSSTPFLKSAISLTVIYPFFQGTNVKGLADTLERIQAQLALCEKALAEYLETKRLAFPR